MALFYCPGFPQARSLDGRCGIVDYGDGEEMLMIMAQLDVVPAGPGWASDPFAPEVRDGRMYGRGVIDDKGPAVSALYALHTVKEAGTPLKRHVRLFLGCDEESGWSCVERYKKTEPEPDLAFTPDGEYPLVNSEKSISVATFHHPMTGSGIRIDCGFASNVIPGEALATLQLRAEAIEQALSELQRCWELFPQEENLDRVNRQWLGKKQALSICESDAAAKNEALRACMNETQGVLNRLRQAVEGLQLMQEHML